MTVTQQLHSAAKERGQDPYEPKSPSPNPHTAPKKNHPAAVCRPQPSHTLQPTLHICTGRVGRLAGMKTAPLVFSICRSQRGEYHWDDLIRGNKPLMHTMSFVLVLGLKQKKPYCSLKEDQMRKKGGTGEKMFALFKSCCLLLQLPVH